MEKAFISVLNMSFTASYAILFVMLIRLPLKKAPKVISYALWSVVVFRLIFPFSFESTLSLLPTSTKTIPQTILYQQSPQLSNLELTDIFINQSTILPSGSTSVKSKPVYSIIGSYIWITGIVVMLIYSIFSIIFLKRKLKTAVLIEENIYEANNLKTPFVFGFFKPSIYIPSGIAMEEKGYILQHEYIHIRRYDHIIKPFAFSVLCIHWFNPLVWLAFMLMSTDMELSCDERVIREMGRDIKKHYAQSLLALATERRIINGGPLTFGEGNVKGRIKNVLNYKKPTFWIVIIALIAAIILGIGLLANPKKEGIFIKPTNATWSSDQIIGADMAVLDYASDDIVIFHGYFGLFVYDLNKFQIIRSLDLKTLDCDKTQGDSYCEVSVSSDGNTVQLYPLSSNNMYVYTVSSNTLKELVYKPMKDKFTGPFVSVEDVRLGGYSDPAILFDTKEYGVLYTSDWTLNTLSYIRGDKTFHLFKGKEN